MYIVYSVVIVNYHSIDEIVTCLRSLMEVHSSDDFEVIIVSNSPVSKDEKEVVDAISSHCKWFQMEKNIGYGQACNAGALESKGDYIFFLNPDTKFINDVLTVLKKQLESRTDKAVAGPATYNSNLKKIPSVKNEISITWMMQWLCPLFGIFSKYTGAYDEQTYEKTTSVDIINGSAIFMHQRAFHDTSGFSEDFFMYWEENDFCVRLKKHGYKILYVPEAKIIHDSGHSTKRIFLPMEIEKHRSQKIFINKHHPGLARVNRLAGIFAYAWRFLGSLVLFRHDKAKQFRTLFMWYLIRY